MESNSLRHGRPKSYVQPSQSAFIERATHISAQVCLCVRVARLWHTYVCGTRAHVFVQNLTRLHVKM